MRSRVQLHGKFLRQRFRVLFVLLGFLQDIFFSCSKQTLRFLTFASMASFLGNQVVLCIAIGYLHGIACFSKRIHVFFHITFMIISLSSATYNIRTYRRGSGAGLMNFRKSAHKSNNPKARQSAKDIAESGARKYNIIRKRKGTFFTLKKKR